MTPLDLVPPGSLSGVRVGISVSTSADLDRLGLSEKHAEVAIGELSRAILIAGGSLVYGGRIKPSGYTQFLLHEVRRYGSGDRLCVCLAEPEHLKLSRSELYGFDADLGTLGKLVCLDRAGNDLPSVLANKAEDPAPLSDPESMAAGYSSMRRYVTQVSHARVVIGGSLDGFLGELPGVVEEACLSLRAGQPLFVAAGFGGAAALVAGALDRNGSGWFPTRFPKVNDEARRGDWTALVREAGDDALARAASDGLNEAERVGLTATHRAGEIASYVVRGLSRVASQIRAV